MIILMYDTWQHGIQRQKEDAGFNNYKRNSDWIESLSSEDEEF